MNRLVCVWLILALAPLLAGCRLFGTTPTPLPWAPTRTPSVTPESPQMAVTSDVMTPTVKTVPPTPTPTQGPPTPTPSPTATESSPVERQHIRVDVPHEGQAVENPVLIRGRTSLMPFEGTLVIRVYDALDQLAAEAPIIAEGQLGGAATFEATITYGGIPGRGRIEVLEFSPRDGGIVERTTTEVVLQGFPGSGYVELPVPMTDVTLPIKLLARAGRPGQELNVTVSWEDGTQFAHVFSAVEGLDGKGLLIVPLDLVGPGSDHPATQAAAIEIHTLEGSPLAWQPVHILHPRDPGTMNTKVYWVKTGSIVPQEIRVPRTVAIARASLEALLWGPVPHNLEGYTTQIPGPEAILSYPRRGDDWGERVRIRSLSIIDGVAYADFSPELGAHSGGAEQVTLIREQIALTLLQFPSVNDVEITIAGQPGLLEP